MPRRTKANLDAERASGFLGPTEPRQRDDDEMSVASTASTFSAVSINPTAHAARRQGERDIETREVQRAKKEGRISLAIRFAGDEHSNKQATETAALEWGARVTAEFEGLQMGEVKTRGAPEDRRIEVEIRGSEKVARRVKEWLKNESYFADPRRVLYVLRQHPQEELVVVEGALQSGAVGLITVFRRDSNTGLEKRTITAAIILYNGVFSDLLHTNADEQSLDAAFLEQVWYDQSHYQSQDLKEAGIPGWVVGPGGHHYKLDRWPPETPFLHAAARMGCAKIVRQLVKRYGCDVNRSRRKDKATALHLAAYYGHSAVVELLLELGADKTLKNKYGETALESAHAAQQEEMQGKFEMPIAFRGADEASMLNFNPDGRGGRYAFDLRTTNPEWPGWKQITQVLRLDDGAAPCHTHVTMSAEGNTVNPGKTHTDEELEEFEFRPRKPKK